MYASIDDVQTLYGATLTAEQYDAATRLLEFASAMIRHQSPGIDARITDGSLDPDLPAAVVTAMVVRVLRNPDGRRQGSHSIDDFSTSWTIDQALSSGALYVSDAELASLLPAPTGLRIGTMKLGHWT